MQPAMRGFGGAHFSAVQSLKPTIGPFTNMNSGLARQLWNDARLWRRIAGVLAVTALAVLVAALVAREPPDFAERPVIAVLRAKDAQPLWALRLARSAHRIAVDALSPLSPPAGKDYQLWLLAAGAAPPQPLGLLPLSGRKILAETPANIRHLAEGAGELGVTLEPASGALAGVPSGPPAFTANLGHGG
jgi:anti-sigma-K factor RskA